MPRAPHRPKELEEETKTLNVIFNMSRFLQIKDYADQNENGSKGKVVRHAVDLYFDGPAQTEPSPPPLREVVDDATGYAEGVRAAALAIAKNSRLNVKMASGGTMGEDIANRILKDLLD
jgi:hypothetical protein